MPRPRNATGESFFAWEGDTLLVNILGKPAASKDAIGTPKGTQLKVSVTAAPKDDKATNLNRLTWYQPLVVGLLCAAVFTFLEK